MYKQQHFADAVKAIILQANLTVRNARNTKAFHKTYKKDGTPVTEIDKEVQHFLSRELKKIYNAQVEGEESDNHIDKHEPFWSIDPIDGTWSFINFENTCSIVVSLIVNQEVVFGVVSNPFTEQYFYAFDNKSFMNHFPLPLKTEKKVAVVNFKPEPDKNIDMALFDLYKRRDLSKIVSLGGSIAYSFCQVAAGIHTNYLAYFRTPSSSWDLSAAFIILKNAGGAITYLNNNPVNPLSHKGFLLASADQNVHEKMLTHLSHYELNRKQLYTVRKSK